MKKLFMIATMAMFVGMTANAQNATALEKGKGMTCQYVCEVTDQGEVIRLFEFRQTPNGNTVSIPIVLKGGGNNPPKEIVTGGHQPNTTYNRELFNCQGPPSDCYRVDWNGTDDL